MGRACISTKIDVENCPIGFPATVSGVFFLNMENSLTNEKSSYMEVPIAVENTATTEFADTGSVVKATFLSQQTKGLYQITQQSLKDFMAKPVLINSDSWDTADLVNNELFTVNPLYQLLNNNIWADKIKGYRLVRGTAVLRFQFNATPFQQGKVRLWYLPDLDPTKLPFHTWHLANKAMTPGTYIDARDSIAEIRVPFVSPYDWIDIKDQTFGWGNIKCTVYVPLSTGTGGSNSVSFSTHLWFEDFELSTPIAPQMQSGKPRKKVASVLAKEARFEESKPLSSSLSMVSSIANTLASVPVLTPLMGPVSWASNILAGTASAFGWSKTLTTQPPSVMASQANRYLACSDGLSMAYPLSLNADRKLPIIKDCTVHDADEMSFDFLKAQPGFVQMMPWSTTDVPSTLLLSMDIDPSRISTASMTTYNGKSVNFSTGPPICYLSKKFAFYRGSICLTLDFAKTDFHTGRLEIVWTPGAGIMATPDLITSSYSIREIFDLENASCVCFDLPYLVAPNYTEVGTSMGRLSVRVLTSLRAPDSVSQSISAVVSGHGGKDFELQVPKFNSSFTFRPQMEGQKSSEKVYHAGGFLDSQRPSTHYSEESIGESFTSVKQILNRNNRVNMTGTTNITVAVRVNPWFTSGSSQSTVTGDLQCPVFGGDAMSYVMGMYAYYRGDAEVSWVPNSGSSSAPLIFASVAPTTFTTNYQIEPATGSTAGVVDWTSPSIVTEGMVSSGIVQNGSGFATVRVPFQSSGKVSRVVMNTGQLMYLDKAAPKTYLNLMCIGNGASTFVYRSLADDAQLLFYVGCPSAVDRIP